MAAPTRNVEIASTSTVNVLRGLVVRATTPLLRDDYLKLLNPLWSARELRGLVEATEPQHRGTVQALGSAQRQGIYVAPAV